MEELKEKRFLNGGRIIIFVILSGMLLCASLLCLGKTVLLVEGGKEEKYYTFSRTVDDFIAEAGVQLKPQDRLLPAAETKLKEGDVIVVRRALPVTLAVDGQEQQSWTHARDVNAFLREKSIIIGEGDLITPGFTHALQAGDRVEVIRVDVEYEPVPPIMEYGDNMVLSRGGRNHEFSEVLFVEATAYCPGTPGSGCPLDEQGHSHCTGFYNDGYTYTGANAVSGDGSLENPHIIAVDPEIIPQHSLVYLEGYGFARALDRGGAIKGMIIDLLFDKHEEALIFGRQQLKVYILSQ